MICKLSTLWKKNVIINVDTRSLMFSCVWYSFVFYSFNDFSCMQHFCIISTFRKGQKLTFDTEDISPLSIWIMIEAFVIVISVFLIVIKPVYVKLFPEKLLTKSDKSSQKKTKKKAGFGKFTNLREFNSGFIVLSYETRTEEKSSTAIERQKDTSSQTILVNEDVLVSSTPKEVVRFSWT